MADDNKLLFVFQVDEKQAEKEFEKIQYLGKDTATKLVGTFQAVNKGGFFGLVAGVTLLNQGLELVGKTVGFIKDSFKAAVDTITDGEKIKLISKQFEILSTQAVGAGSGLRDALKEAAGGLVDTDELLKATNRVLLEFNGNVSDLPKLMETARKVTKITGGDLLETFKDFNQAIGTQSTRTLRSNGIFVDAAEAQKKYAAQIGKSVELFTELDKRQAITNSILEVSKNQLKDISLSTDNAIGSFKKLGAQSEELGQAITQLISNALKPIAVPISNFFTDLFKGITNKITANFGEGSEKIQAQIAVLEAQINGFRTRLQSQNFGMFSPEQLKENIDKAVTQLNRLRDIQQASIDDQKKAAAARGDLPENVKAALAGYIVDPKVVAQRNQEFQNALISAQQANLGLRIAEAERITNEDARESALKGLRLQQIEVEEANHLARLSELKKKYEIDRTLTQQQFNALVEQENIRSQLQIEAYESQSNERKRKQALDYEAKIKSINTAIQNGVIKVVSESAQRLGAALVKGGSAFADFQKTILDIIGNIAIQIGETLVGIGLGIEQLKAGLFTLSGGPAIAAGLALIALGGLLKSLSGGSAVSGTAADTGGGIASTTNDTGLFEPPEDAKAEKPGQSVVVNVHGNVFDRRQTGLEIAEVIRESFESQGTTIVGAV